MKAMFWDDVIAGRELKKAWIGLSRLWREAREQKC